MILVWFYSFISIFIVSLISLLGIFFLAIQPDKLKKFLLLFVSFAAGGLLGGAFLHLLPEIIKETDFSAKIALYILSGIIFSFFSEKIIRWRHCHLPINKDHVHPVSLMSLLGDGVHNFIDGLIIGASYLINIPLGITTTIAVILHEIPQEIGDFGVLLYGGFSKKKALVFNFLTALTAVLGAIIALVLHSHIPHLTFFLIPFAIGTFIYIAGSDLIPELHRESQAKKSLLELLMFISGILVMLLMLLLE